MIKLEIIVKVLPKKTFTCGWHLDATHYDLYERAKRRKNNMKYLNFLYRNKSMLHFGL